MASWSYLSQPAELCWLCQKEQNRSIKSNAHSKSLLKDNKTSPYLYFKALRFANSYYDIQRDTSIHCHALGRKVNRPHCDRTMALYFHYALKPVSHALTKLTTTTKNPFTPKTFSTIKTAPRIYTPPPPLPKHKATSTASQPLDSYEFTEGFAQHRNRIP